MAQSGSELQAFLAGLTHSIEAYEWYLKGRAMLARRGKSRPEGVACMERALALDPEYGLAWAGIAEAHVILGYYGLITPEQTRPARCLQLRGRWSSLPTWETLTARSASPR